jgi:MFS family permease
MTPASQFWSYLSLNRNVGVLALSTLAIALGEELWLAFLPKYLVVLGASGLVVGLFGSAKDLLDGIYQYPGGWVADRFGRKSALMTFTIVAMGGYALAAIAPTWWVMFPALVLIMGWKSGAFPVSFAVIGDALPKGKRGTAFSIQSIMQRFPRVVGAPLGGFLILALGVGSGVRAALAVTIVLAVGIVVVQRMGFAEDTVSVTREERQNSGSPFKRLPLVLRRLLFVECLVRMGEAVAASFIILYVTDVLKVGIESYGLLYALQQSVAIVMYLPAGKLADIAGRRSLIALTFLFFALFPFAVFIGHSTLLLVTAFVIGGLKEFGEPARKSFIVDHVPASERGRAVGTYYMIRNLTIVPGGLIGGILWGVSTELLFVTALALGLLGLVVFLLVSGKEFR